MKMLIDEQVVPGRLNGVSDQTLPADLIKAHVVLLERELIQAKQGDLFRLVQHHYYRLQNWHDQHTGWRIQRSSKVIRLERRLSATTPGYLYDRLREPRDFACLTWILWYAENRQLSGRGNDQQFLLSQLAEQIQEQAMGDGGAFDFRRPGDRYSIQRALNYLEGLGGLQLVDGQAREWVAQVVDADVLYEFTEVSRSLIASLRIDQVTQLAEELADAGAIVKPSRISMVSGVPDLIRAWRALLLGPALFKFDDPAAFVAVQQHADRLATELLATFGWLLDLRHDYACIVRASGSNNGPVSVLTPYGTNDQIALLLCTAIREQIQQGIWSGPDANGCLLVATEDMAALFYSVRERYGDNWGNEARSRSSQSLLNDVYRKMRQMGVIRGPGDSGHVLVLPTAARYRATYEAPAAGTANTTTTLRNRGKNNRKR
ncbi:hypothetical protein KDW_06560 [Dictyobacter vulcani]|uniref:TIGR02678 family protein n=1 Tax=Dictyobacter vulcani TaxID=2607529 RepID=A0A5J4KCD6_9CHLR|nr:TIGR02678 family protein [Dictyobacter vulcani]GER86494.1 hypothetical protein KDW_06560 [Dictyobacter vulcani]